MKPLERAWFFSKTVKPREERIKTFVDTEELRVFTKKLRERGKYHVVTFIDGNEDIPVKGQLGIFDSNVTKNRMWIVRYL